MSKRNGKPRVKPARQPEAADLQTRKAFSDQVALASTALFLAARAARALRRLSAGHPCPRQGGKKKPCRSCLECGDLGCDFCSATQLLKESTDVWTFGEIAQRLSHFGFGEVCDLTARRRAQKLERLHRKILDRKAARKR